MGFISGFVSGAAKATSDVALMQIQDKSEREKAEADALRRKALAEYEQGMEDARLDKKMTFEGEQNRLDRESEERRAGMKSSRGASAKVIKSTDDEGNEIFLRYDPETDEMVEVGRGAGSAPKVSIEQAQQMARREAEDKAGFFSSDKSDFGGSREEWINRRALEIVNGAGGEGTPSVETGRASSRPASAPTFEEYAARVRQANPGTEIPEADLRAKYESRFGKAPSKKPANDKPPAKAQKQAPTEKKPDPKKTPDQRLADIEERLRADDELKAPGSGGILTRAIKARQMPLGLLERRNLEKERDRLRKELGAAK